MISEQLENKRSIPAFDRLFVISQYLAPQHLISRAVGLLANTRHPAIKNALIRWFIQRYQVNMAEALHENAEDYACFNDFFTRELKPGARTFVTGANEIACPVDGAISQLGSIGQGRIFQAKGHHFDLVDLLGGNQEFAAPFEDGEFATIYLSPKDYHRIHMPLAGKLKAMVHVPGDLFSVNPVTVENVPNLFARNERVVALFDTEQGPMAMVLVGAMIVASIETVWAGQVAPRSKQVTTIHYGETAPALSLEQGAEMGRFKLGSTVVLLFPKGKMQWAEGLTAGAGVRLGQLLGTKL